MSSRVYVDGRTIELANCHAIIQRAMEDLEARRSQVSCGRAEVVPSRIDVSDAVKAFENARFQDKVEVKPTNELTEKLGRVAPDYSAEVLGDWRPDVSKPSIHVDNGEVEGQGHMRLVEDLECAALDGARLMIFEVDDGLGNTSYQMGLETSLFDEDGQWKSDATKARYENFLKKALADDRAGDGDGGAAAEVGGNRFGAAMRVAGLGAKKREKVPGGTATVWSTPKKEEAPPKAKGARSGFRIED